MSESLHDVSLSWRAPRSFLPVAVLYGIEPRPEDTNSTSLDKK